MVFSIEEKVQGILELRMPLQEHEKPKVLLGNFVEAIADEVEIEILQLGSFSLKREDLQHFIEPYTCFYIQNELRVRERRIDLDIDPPPDLAIESDYTHSSTNKLAIYASLSISELWRYTRKVYKFII